MIYLFGFLEFICYDFWDLSVWVFRIYLLGFLGFIH